MTHVLIVDDDADIRMTMRLLLEDMGGYTVLEATDGVSGLEMVRASAHPLVVLLDLLMPQLDGLGVLRAVAKDERLATRHAYVLVTVSRQGLSVELPASLQGVVPVVAKPFDITVLLDTVAEAARCLHEPDNV
ncbi:MAG TPA: response regulator [Ktedonobacterales bacterium]